MQHRSRSLTRRHFVALGSAGLATGVARLGWAARPQGPERWGVFELALEGPRDGNPYREVQLSATFTQGARRLTAEGFFDGDGIYRVRFMPPTTGPWRWVTRSDRPELDGKTGAFTATRPAPDNHGPVRVRHTHHLAYEDGTPYFQVGTTCYAWIHQPERMQEQTLETLGSAPFNKIRFCVFPKAYKYNANEPGLFAFERRADGSFDFSRPSPPFWRHLERRILDLQKLGIEADLILWHPYDRWGFATMSPDEDDRYLRYAVARLGAYRNVWWSLANEFDFMAPNAMKGHRGNKGMEDWDRFFRLLVEHDPYAHLRSIHNGKLWYDHTRPWVTHASVQSSQMAKGVEWRQKYGKPILIDECRYEGDIPEGWGNISAEEMTLRFWLGALGGCYVGHGETYKHPEDLLWWSKGGVLRGQSPPRIAWFRDIFAKGPPFHELVPTGDGQARFSLAKDGAYYLVYCPDDKPQTVQLAGRRPYAVDVLDPWEMTETSLGSAGPGQVTLTPPKPRTVLRFRAQPARRRA